MYLIVVGAFKRENCLNILRRSLHHRKCQETLKLEIKLFV